MAVLRHKICQNWVHVKSECGRKILKFPLRDLSSWQHCVETLKQNIKNFLTPFNILTLFGQVIPSTSQKQIVLDQAHILLRLSFNKIESFEVKNTLSSHNQEFSSLSLKFRSSLLGFSFKYRVTQIEIFDFKWL